MAPDLKDKTVKIIYIYIGSQQRKLNFNFAPSPHPAPIRPPSSPFASPPYPPQPSEFQLVTLHADRPRTVPCSIAFQPVNVLSPVVKSG